MIGSVISYGQESRLFQDYSNNNWSFGQRGKFCNIKHRIFVCTYLICPCNDLELNKTMSNFRVISECFTQLSL